MFCNHKAGVKKDSGISRRSGIQKTKQKAAVYLLILLSAAILFGSCNYVDTTGYPSDSDLSSLITSSPSSSSTSSVSSKSDSSSISQPDSSDSSSSPLPTATPTLTLPDIFMYINVGVANMRTTPSSSSDSTIIRQLHYRSRVRRLNTTGNWSLVVTDTDETGYVFTEYLSDTMPDITPSKAAEKPFEKWPAEYSLGKSYYTTDLSEWLGRSIDYTPLKGITVILDPGHGGADPGAVYMDSVYEKTINLKVSLAIGEKLTEMGAEVVYTRRDDRTLSLYYRNAFIGKYILEKHKKVLQDSGEDVAETDRLIGLMQEVMDRNTDVIAKGGRGAFLGLGVNADIRTVMDITSEYDDIILLSIHCNSILNSSSSRGVEIYYGTNNGIYNDEKHLLAGEDPSNPVNPEYQFYNDAARQKFAKSLRDGIKNETGLPMRGPNDGIYAWNFCMLRENNLTSALVELGFISNAKDREYLQDPLNQKIMALGIAKSIYNYFCVG